jgi:type VI secretion system secreted protein Hcp
MAQTNLYLKLDGVDGESLDKDHKDWIELESFNWGVSNGANMAKGQGGQAAQAHFASLTVTKHVDKASVPLFKDCATGKHIPKGTISCMKLDGDSRVEYLKIELTDILVASADFSAHGEHDMVHEHVALNFAEFKKSYKLQQDIGSAGGSSDFGFNLQTSTAT